MADHFKERSTRDYHQKQMFTKEELEARESLCVHDEPPFCSASCPLKLDVRAFLKLVSQGSLAGARAMLERVTPLPEILCADCGHPCEAACRLGEKGEPAAIRQIEKAVMVYGEPKTGRGLLKFKKKKKAAVFGTELFTLAAALEMANKSYPTILHTESSTLEALIKTCAPYLDESGTAAVTRRIKASDLTIDFGWEPEHTPFERDAADLVCGASYLAGDGVDPVSLTDAQGRIAGRPGCDTLTALYDARRAGVSADRIAQGLDPRLSRGEEGPVESRLYTDMTDVKPSERVIPASASGGYSAEEAIREASRCLMCSCTECMKACPYLRHYNKFPKTMTREIYNNTGIIMGNHTMNGAMNSCALCGQCAVVCPNGYDLGDICRLARENMVSTGKMSLAVHEFALLDMLFSNGGGFLSRPSPMDREEHGGLPSYVFFPGCQACADAPEAVLCAYRDLNERLPGGCGIILGCCGAIAQWAGRKEMYGEQKAFLTGQIVSAAGKAPDEDTGDVVLIAGCPTCLTTLRQDQPFKAVGLWDILAEIGLPEGACGRQAAEGSVILHDSCGARQDPATREAVRALARQMGFEVEEEALSGDKVMCCGYGGLVSYTNKDVASAMAQVCLGSDPAEDNLIDNAKTNAAGAKLTVTYCMACRDRLAREGADARHIMEIVYDAPAGPPPDISEKRRNRLLLKEKIKEIFWGESAMPEEFGFEMIMNDEVRRQMDDRMILDQDVLAVMKAFRESGEAILDKENGWLITRHRIGNVTFWVQFTETENGYDIHHVYSHRMTVRKR